MLRDRDEEIHKLSCTVSNANDDLARKDIVASNKLREVWLCCVCVWVYVYVYVGCVLL